MADVLTVLTTGDVARRLGLSAKRIDQLARRGRLRVFAVTPQGMRLYSPATVAEYARTRTRGRASQGRNDAVSREKAPRRHIFSGPYRPSAGHARALSLAGPEIP